MPDKQLYVLPVANDAEITSRSQIRRRVQSFSGLDTGGSVEPIGLEPGEQILHGWYRGKYSAMMAREIEELFDAPDISSVPLFALDASETLDERGYYALSNTDVFSPEPKEDSAPKQFDGRLRKMGTRRSHWRSLDTEPAQVTNDFGNDTTGYVGVESTASKIRWFNPTDKSIERPSAAATRNAEFADVELYDTEAASFDNPILIYQLGYDKEYLADPFVYDDRGNASRDDTDGIVQWAHVFTPAHEFEGDPVISNGLLRLTFDEATPDITAESWDNGTSSWTSTSLGTQSSESWQLEDIDITEIGQHTVRAQVEFRNTNASPDDFYSLNFALHRGYNNAQWTKPDGESGATPADLINYLDPIANESIVDPNASQTITPRSETRK